VSRARNYGAVWGLVGTATVTAQGSKLRSTRRARGRTSTWPPAGTSPGHQSDFLMATDITQSGDLFNESTAQPISRRPSDGPWPRSWTGPRAARCPCQGSISATPGIVCVPTPTAQESGVDAKQRMRASPCPAAGFGLLDASTGSPELAATKRPAPRLGGPLPGRRQTRTLEAPAPGYAPHFRRIVRWRLIIDVLRF
jgi:hypothetical protein